MEIANTLTPNAGQVPDFLHAHGRPAPPVTDRGGGLGGSGAAAHGLGRLVGGGSVRRRRAEDVGAEVVAGDAGRSFNREHLLGRHLAATAPVRDDVRLHVEETGKAGRPTHGVNGLVESGHGRQSTLSV